MAVLTMLAPVPQLFAALPGAPTMPTAPPRQSRGPSVSVHLLPTLHRSSAKPHTTSLPTRQMGTLPTVATTRSLRARVPYQLLPHLEAAEVKSLAPARPLPRPRACPAMSNRARRSTIQMEALCTLTRRVPLRQHRCFLQRRLYQRCPQYHRHP